MGILIHTYFIRDISRNTRYIKDSFHFRIFKIFLLTTVNQQLVAYISVWHGPCLVTSYEKI